MAAQDSSSTHEVSLECPFGDQSPDGILPPSPAPAPVVWGSVLWPRK